MSLNDPTDHQREPTRYVATISVIDPETHLPVEVEIRRCQSSGAMIGLDGAWLQQSDDDAFSPYDRNVLLVIPDDERPQSRHSISVLTDRDQERFQLAKDVYLVVYDATDSFEEEPVLIHTPQG